MNALKTFTASIPALLGVMTSGLGGGRCEAEGAHPSIWVYPSYDGELLYNTDTNGVRINDFSECGYKRGLVELPNVTNLVDQSRWLYLHPLGGSKDDGPGINAALNFVGSFQTNAYGFRGVVCLGPGTFIVSPTSAIIITNSGVVLKGSGSSPSTGTMIYAAGLTKYDLITITSGAVGRTWSDATAQMQESFVSAGTRTFRIFTTNTFNVGDQLMITRPVRDNWVHDLDMDRLNGIWIKDPQHSGDYERVLTRIEGDWFTVDTPLPQTFSANYGGGIIGSFTWPRIQNCGVEDLYCNSQYIPGTNSELHAETAVHWVSAENTWARNVTAAHFGSYTFRADTQSKFITMAACQSLDPESPIAGGYRYSFYIDGQSQYILVRDCYASDGRHDFVLAAQSPGPNAFVRCSSDNANEASGPHERWSTGVLFDNVSESGDGIQVSNLGNGGGGSSAHGWAGAYIPVWNCYAEDGFRVRNPPSARNWLIGSGGFIEPSKRGCWYNFIPLIPEGDCWAVGADPEGTYDQSGISASPVQLHSLYYAQLQQRLKYPGSYFREYRLGKVGWTPGDDNDIPVDTNWLAQVRTIAGPGAVVGSNFDLIASNRWTAFTFNFPIAPGEQVVASSLSLGLVVPPGDHHVYLYTVDVPQSFASLGWVSTNDGSARYTVEFPPVALQGGQLNVAIDGNCGVDFAMLHFQAAPVIPASTERLNPLDAYVRGGDYANQNFATDVELIVKNDSDDSFSRRAFLDWDLVEALNYPGPLVDAKVRLYCTYSGQPGNEQSVAKVPDGSWLIPTLTWNNQPPANPPFAYFVPQPESYSEFTVTPQVAAVLAGPNKRLSLCIDSARDWGSHGDVAYASTEDADPSHWPQLILSFANSPPSIAGPSNQTMSASSTLGPLPVAIGDAETPAASLVLTATSSVPTVIANSEITLGGSVGGSGSNRTVSIAVPAGRLGASIITLLVSDGTQVATASFRVVVNCFTLSPPTISAITNQIFNEDTTQTVPFNIGSQCGSFGPLFVNVSSSNQQLFPPGSLQVVSGLTRLYNRALTMTPGPNQNGTATISISVSDGTLETNETFLATVRPVEDPPQYVRITRPRSGDNLPPGVPALLSADAFDVETNLARIDFFAQPNQLLGRATNAPYSVTWSNPPAGSFILYAIAYDTTGLSATSPPVNLTVSAPVFYPPRLYVSYLSNSLALAWLDSVSSNALQTATSLVPPVAWSPVTNPPLVGEGAWFYFVSPTESRRFYRLAY